LYSNTIYKNEILRNLKICESMQASGAEFARTKMNIIVSYNREIIFNNEYNQFRFICDSLYNKHGIIDGVLLGQDLFVFPKYTP